jgi:hypothetical protein
LDHTVESGADDYANGQIHHVAAQYEFTEFA